MRAFFIDEYHLVRTAKQYYVGPILFLVVLIGLWFCLQPGLTGGFLFDDIPNLSDLGAYGGVTDWPTFKAYVFGGFSGPSGRPLSLLSFLLDDNTWPSDPYSFKRTNLLIHLLNFCALAALSLQLLRVHHFEENKAQRIAILSASVWALHPFMVSTTMYVVQRMALLSTLFSLLGLAGFLWGRQLFERSSRSGQLVMGISLLLGTTLATLSKENGALLPLLALVLEACRPQNLRPLPRMFSAVFMWLPSLAVSAILIKYIDLSANPWPARSFNQVERLFSESRIIFDYLGSLLLPRIEDAGLYQDGFVISKGLLSPISTLFSICGVFGLLMFAWKVRCRMPFVAIAILFFFCSHLLESTVIGLELYFEHRNYMAATLLFLPIMEGLDNFHGRISRGVSYGAPVCLLLVLGGLTYERATLWGDAKKLEIYWALAATESPRAQSSLANELWLEGRAEEALAQIDAASDRLNTSSLLTVNRLYMHVSMHQISDQDFSDMAKRLADQPLDPQAITALRNLVTKVREPSMPKEYREGTYQILDYLETHAAYRGIPVFRRVIPYMKAQLLLTDGDVDGAQRFFSEAIALYGSVDSGMQMVAEMANSGNPKAALKLLDQVSDIYAQQEESAMKFSKFIYGREISRIRNTLLDEIRKGYD